MTIVTLRIKTILVYLRKGISWMCETRREQGIVKNSTNIKNLKLVIVIVIVTALIARVI